MKQIKKNKQSSEKINSDKKLDNTGIDTEADSTGTDSNADATESAKDKSKKKAGLINLKEKRILIRRT